MSIRLISRPVRAGFAVFVAAAGLVTSIGAWAHDTGAPHDHTAPYLYVVNRASADIAVIDTTDLTVVGRVPVGKVPHQAIVAEALNLLVVSNTADDTISVVDLKSLTTAATIALDSEPEHMELSPDGMTVAVGNIAADTVSFVSLSDKRETARVTGLFEPHNLTFSPDGTHLYVSNLGGNHVSKVNVAEGRVVAEIPVAPNMTVARTGAGGTIEHQGIINVTATRDGRLGFAAHGDGNTLSVIDLTTGAKVKDLALGDRPWRAYASADGTTMVVPNNGSRTVSLIDVATQEVTATLPGGSDMTGVNTSPHSPIAFVISRGDDKAILIDMVTRQPAGEIALPGMPETAATSPDGKRIYVALSRSGQVAVIDVRKRAVIKTIDGVGDEPWGVTMAGAHDYCH